MAGFPSSPRVRRRLVALAVAAGVGGAVAALLILLPETAPSNPAPTGHTPAEIARKVNLHVGRAERREIDTTLDRFIPAGVGRGSMTTAWRLAGPEMKAASTLPEWRRDTSPIPYYPVAKTTFHDWTVIDSGPHYVLFNVLVHARPGLHKPAWVLSGEMVKRGSRWLVNRLYTTAIMAPPDKHGQHEVGPADFTAPAAIGTPTPGKPKLPKTWLLAAVGVIGLALLFPFGFGVASVARSRRARREYERTGSRAALPPLPVGARPLESSPGHEPIGPQRR